MTVNDMQSLATIPTDGPAPSKPSGVSNRKSFMDMGLWQHIMFGRQARYPPRYPLAMNYTLKEVT